MTRTEALFDYSLQLGDTALIHGQRLAEWCGHAPILEEDIALTNISLDLIGQARIALTYAAQTENLNRDEDKLAFHRDARDFKNVLMAELPNGDFGFTIGKVFFISHYMKHLYAELVNAEDKTLKAFAEKSLKEVLYHCRHSADWVIRLGDGTRESHEKMQNAIHELAPFTDDLFDSTPAEQLLINEGVIPPLSELKSKWTTDVNKVITEATLEFPATDNFLRTGGKRGLHTEHLGHILSEMQFLQRAYPDAKW